MSQTSSACINITPLAPAAYPSTLPWPIIAAEGGTRRERNWRVLVIPGRRKAASPESIATDRAGFAPVVIMDSGLRAELVIGPATSGRTRWLGPGMTGRDYAGAAPRTRI